MSTPGPTRSADTAAPALHELATTTRKGVAADQTYGMLAAIQAGLASMQQTLAGLATWHATHAPQTGGGRQSAHEAAQILERAAALTGQAGAHVDAAWAHNGRIVWPEPPTPTVGPGSPDAASRAARPVRPGRDGLSR